MKPESKSLVLAGFTLMLVSSVRPSLAQSAAVSPNIQDYVAQKLDDFSANMKVLQYDERAGRKIGREFGMVYKIGGNVTVQYKEENKIRVEGFIAATKATYVLSGTEQSIRTSLGVKDVRDIGNAPGKRTTLLDAGLLSAGYLSYSEAQFTGVKPVSGTPCAVFKLTFRDKKLDSSYRMVWIDPHTRVILKREEYHQDGKLKATFAYREPKEVAPGIWFPSRIEAFNDEGKKAGETAYRNVRVNQGLDEKLFHL